MVACVKEFLTRNYQFCQQHLIRSIWDFASGTLMPPLSHHKRFFGAKSDARLRVLPRHVFLGTAFRLASKL
jgi:hypothetical protein